MSTTRKDQIQSLWLHRLACALRTALACTIVGCTVLYSPVFLRRIFTYPAFSYMTLILIVPEATLGDTLRGFWHVFFATIQVMVPSMLSLLLIGPARFTKELSALAVALSAFAVALPASTSLMAKRIAFGQIVIVYVGTFVHGAQTGTFMHPIHVAACSLLGALASVLALLFPYPLLASYQFRKACRVHAENTSERLTLIVEAIFAQNSTVALELLSQEKTLSLSGIKFLQNIKDNMAKEVQDFMGLKKMREELQHHVNQLESFISEAESEPNFWFLPFNGSCYRKLHDSLSTLTSLLLFVDYQMEFLSQVVSHRFGGTTIEELLEQVNGNLEAFYKIVGSSLGYIEEATSTMSLQEFKNQIIDIELAKLPIENETKLLGTEDLNRENILSSFFEHLDKVIDKLYAYEGEEEQLKCQMVLHLTAMGFCIRSLMRGTMEMEKEVKELVNWERG